ncbi:hypothetical protein ACJX0J_041485 [Zea mays]
MKALKTQSNNQPNDRREAEIMLISKSTAVETSLQDFAGGKPHVESHPHEEEASGHGDIPANPYNIIKDLIYASLYMAYIVVCMTKGNLREGSKALVIMTIEQEVIPWQAQRLFTLESISIHILY